MIALLSSSTGWAQDFAGGAGTPADPYQIENWDHFNNIRDHLSADFVLNNALTPDTPGYTTHIKDGTTLANGGEGWIPIGVFNSEFVGSFDGQGYAIEGLAIDRTLTINDSTEQGLFGFVGQSSGPKQGTIQDLRMVDVDI